MIIPVGIVVGGLIIYFLKRKKSETKENPTDIRDQKIKKYLPDNWNKGYDNVWLVVSVENKKHGLPRIERLKKVPAKIRFLSIEPLLEDLGEVDLIGIDWVIVGGESGHGYRKMKKKWVLNIQKQCEEQPKGTDQHRPVDPGRFEIGPCTRKVVA